MNRKFGVKAIAIFFMASGIMYLGMFFLPFFDKASDKSLNLVYLVYTSFLLQAGWWLFNLKDMGRNLVIFLLSLRAIANSVVLGWFFLQDKSDFSVVVNFLGKPFFNSEDPLSFVSIEVIWFFIVVAMIMFLSQKETRQIFSSDDGISQSQAEAISQ